MKSKERKKETKKEKSDKAGSKVLTDYQREKQSKSENKLFEIPQK